VREHHAFHLPGCSRRETHRAGYVFGRSAAKVIDGEGFTLSLACNIFGKLKDHGRIRDVLIDLKV
jgi:hypothetical protein